MDWASLGYDIISQILSIVVPAVITGLGIYIITYLKKKGVKQDYIEAVEAAYKYLSDCVIYVNQTIVDYAKSNGTWTKQKQKEAKQACMERFNACLTDATKVAIEAVYGSMEEWLETNIEALVNENKTNILPEVICVDN